LTIAAIYKNRWQIELFFKWLKQNLAVKHFFGNSINAVKAQISRVRQLNAQAIDLSRGDFKNVYYKRDICCG